MSLRSMVIVTVLMAAFFALLIYGFAQALREPRMNSAPVHVAVGKPEGPPADKPGPQGPPADAPGPGVEVCPQTLPECRT